MNKKKIAIIELETHAPLLEQWYALLVDASKIEIHFWVHPKVAAHLQSIPHSAITVVQNTDSILPLLPTYEAVVIQTMHRHFRDYTAIMQRVPTLCLVHNLRFSCLGHYPTMVGLWQERERWLYWLKLILKENVFGHRKQLTQATQWAFLSDTIRQQVAQNTKAQTIQLHYNQTNSLPSTTCLQIVIPGSIDPKRKDIALVCKVLKALQPKSRLHFQFLGKPAHATIKNQLELVSQQLHPNVSLSYALEYVKSQDFENAMQQAHLVFCPVQIATYFYGVAEQYGTTKVSGSEADCIRYGKVGIFPAQYPAFHWHNWHYENDEMLIAYFNNLTFEQVEAAHHQLQPYIADYQRTKIQEQLQEQLIHLSNTPL